MCIPPYDSFFIVAKTKDLLSAYPMGKVARLISRKIDNGLEYRANWVYFRQSANRTEQSVGRNEIAENVNSSQAGAGSLRQTNP
jgi:hypothetical protein